MQLRPELVFEKNQDRFGDPIVVICDPLVRRFFSLPGEAEVLLDRLRESAQQADLARDFGELFEESQISALLRELGNLNLLDEGLAPDALRARIRSKHRADQWTVLRDTLRRAGERVPVYRAKFSGVNLDIKEPSDLLALPYLTKADIREHYPDGLLPDGIDLDSLLQNKELRLSTSSGTSAGDRLQMIFSTEARGLQMAAGAAINGALYPFIDRHQATLTSMHCADPDVCVRHTPDMAGRIRDGNRLLLMPPDDPGAPTLDEVRKVFDELKAFDARWLDCNPSYLTNVTYAALDAGIELPRIEVITCGFEFLTKANRAFLRKAWGCGVYNRYTASELGTFQVLECDRGSLHVNDRYYYPEIVRDGRHVRPGEIGRLVQTTLQETIPLLRYDTGDLFVASEDKQCECGSVNRVIGAVAGRASDLISACDGSPRTTREIDDALSTVEGMRVYQVAQTAATSYRVKVVCDPTADAATVRSAAADALRGTVGANADVRTELARYLYPEPSGKFRIVRSELPGLERLISVK